MVISSLIRALLEENSVTISGFGTFFVKRLPTQIKDDIIFPPQNIIEFDFSEHLEGFDFVSKVSKWEQIRIDEAQTEVAQWLNLLQKGLEHNETVFFEDFGTFSKNAMGKIVFQSIINSQLNIENEGFEPIIMDPKMPKEVHKEMVERVQDKREIKVERKKKKRDFTLFIIIIVAAIVVLGALFFKDTIAQFYRTIFEKTETPAALVEDNSTKFDYMDTAENATTSFIEVENTEPKIIEPETPVSPKTNNIYLSYQKGKYYVIAGSFLKEEDALRHIKNEKLEKYQAKLIVHPNNPRIRVSVGIFDNKADAESFAEQFKKNYWVLK